jgi:arylsulfatase A-like enzyme
VGERVSGLATLEDIAPTILDWLGLPAPDTAQGVSLLPLILRGEAVRGQTVSQDKSRRSRHALVAGGYKLIYDFTDASAQLYDLEADGAETRDRAREEPQRTAELQRRLAARVAENTRLAERFRARPQGALLSEREQESLRALGYLEKAHDGPQGSD